MRSHRASGEREREVEVGTCIGNPFDPTSIQVSGEWTLVGRRLGAPPFNYRVPAPRFCCELFASRPKSTYVPELSSPYQTYLD